MTKKIEIRIMAFCVICFLIITQNLPMVVSATNNNPQERGFQMDGDTLVHYTGTDKHVSIPDFVKVIGESAFESNTTMEKVTIPEGVEEISYRGFAECTGLKTVVIPDSLEKIETAAFSNCNQLLNVNLGNSVKEIGIGVFAGCDRLKEVQLSKKQLYFSIKDGALYDRNIETLYQVFPGRENEKFEMPSSVLRIQPYAFWGCDHIENIYISTQVKEISDYAFSNCKSLRSIQIPYSVNRIGIKAFEDCINLRKTIIEPNVTEIHATAFDGCVHLYIDADEGTYADRYAKEHEYIKTDQIEYEDTGTDEKEESEEPIAPVNPLDTEGLLAASYVVANKAFLFIDNTKALVYDGNDVSAPIENHHSLEDDENNEEMQSESINTDEIVTKGFQIPKLKIVNENHIAGQAYYKDKTLVSYDFPSGIESIGDFAFARSGLKEIVLPKGIEEIGYGAFYHCDSLNNITIPSSVTKIDAKAFEKTPWLTNWKDSANDDNDFLIVGDGILLAYRGDSDTVILPSSVKQIAPEVFLNKKNIKEVILPNSLITIGEKAFYNCTSLKQITGGTSVQELKDRCFYNCPVTSIRIPDSVISIGAGAFATPDCKFDDYERNVVFHGNEIPKLSYSLSAHRLSDSSARSMPFEGIKVAVLLKDVSSYDDTVLDAKNQGFRGIICNYPENTSGVLTCIGSTFTKEELMEEKIPEKIYVYDVPYYLEKDSNLTNLGVDRSKEFTYEGKILFSVDCDYFPDETLLDAQLEGNTSEYYLRIRNDASASEKIKKAYENVYKIPLENETYGFQMDFIDATNDLTIEKLGRQLLKVKMPVPDVLEGKTFRFVCLDSDGQLENVDYTLILENESLYFSYELNHLSTFGFFVTGEVPSGMDPTLATGELDDSPDTGEGIQPIVIFILGTFSLTIAFFIFVNRKKSSSIS